MKVCEWIDVLVGPVQGGHEEIKGFFSNLNF